MVKLLNRKNSQGSRRLARFIRAEDGSTTVMALFLLMGMLFVGGIAVDIMRYEANRSKLQATLDRAVLAAANLDNTRDPYEVVEDYFRKAGLLDKVTNINVIEGINGRTVSATAELAVTPIFMIGVDNLTAPAAGAATESVSDIEVIMVLDVSGSMNSFNRIENLRDAAVEFVEIVLQDDVEQRVSIGIVPYNGQVNLGPELFSRFNITDPTGVANVNCVDLPASAYDDIAMSRTAPMPATGYVDTWSTTTRANAYYHISNNFPRDVNMWCPPMAQNVVTLPTRNQALLESRINGLTAIGATSINAGMVWGLNLMNPDNRPMFNELIGMGAMTMQQSGRPYDWDRDNTLKVIVLMTDGEHFPEERLNPAYRSGDAPIWRANDGYMSIFHADRVNNSTSTTICNSRPYWVPHLSQWHSRPWNGSSPNTGLCYNPSTTNWSGTTRQTWPQVWSQVRMHWVAWQMYGRPLGSTNTERAQIADFMMNQFRTRTEVADMDNQLQDACNMAKAQNVVIFSVAFEALPGGEEQLFLCATSPSHYYDAQGLEVRAAFRSIASQINALRLVQ